MFFVKVDGNNIYVVFQDLSEESRDVSAYISRKLNEYDSLPSSLHSRIKKFFVDNSALSNNFERQKSYVSNLKTYIDVVSLKNSKTTYYLNLYILPKDIEIKGIDNDDIDFHLIEKLSLKIFQLYNEEIEKKDIEFKALKEFKGESFLDLELSFYEQELKRLHDHLLNYTRSLSNKIVCSDKAVGIPIDDMNRIEPNPLKQYQFVKVSHQTDLIVFVYSLIYFLQKERIELFKTHKKYQKLKTISLKIYNFLKKISTSKHLKLEPITMKNLKTFFIRYKNSPEIQKNRLIYDILENIFSNQLKEGVFLSKSIDMTKMFEVLVERRLRDNYENYLFTGDESAGIIRGKEPYATKLNEINYLLKDSINPTKQFIKQFPDYLIRSGMKYHIVDAKYKLKDRLFKSRDNFWQILIYAQLFNKIFIQRTRRMDCIQKVIVYADRSTIQFDEECIDNLKLDRTSIDVISDGKVYEENVFDSTIKLLEIKVFLDS